MTEVNRLRDEDGKLPAFAWPGGYPMFYITRDGLTICPDCANKNDIDENQAPVDGGVHWEGPAIECEDCGKSIESAYGDPDAESES